MLSNGGAWWAAIYGVAQSRTRLEWLSSSNLYICVCVCVCVYFRELNAMINMKLIFCSEHSILLINDSSINGRSN